MIASAAAVAAIELCLGTRNRWLLLSAIVLTGFALVLGFVGAAPTGTVVMRWDGAKRPGKGKGKGKAGQPIAFVGKGVCFDTGGISLKPAAGMEDMKWDMGGAGVVLGLMKVLAG